MSGWLTDWVRAVTGAALLSALALALAPAGQVKKVVRLAAGAACVLALLSPLGEPDTEDLARDLAGYREAQQQLVADAKETAAGLERTVIEEACAAYIWDKAGQLGLSLTSAEVRVRWCDEGYWYPSAAEICAPPGQETDGLRLAIAGELGIPEEQQEWSEP